MEPAARAASHLARLATAPRAAGGTEEARVRRYCAEVLAAQGYTVAEAPFLYSALVGQWATPVAGVLAMLVFAAAAALGRLTTARDALAMLLAAALVALLGGRWLTRRGVLVLPFGRRDGVNLVATRGARPPKTWLVAHLDSKSQPVPIGLRAVSFMGIGIVAVAMVVVALLGVARVPIAGWLWSVTAVLGILAAIPIALTTVDDRSPGALDNASGVATVLVASELIGPAGSVAVLLTSAEELGLAGARAWAAEHPPGNAINVDGVDDVGELTCMVSRRGLSMLARAVRDGAARCETPVTVRLVIPGILTDGVALSDAGWQSVTISKGSWRTLARIHTANDDLRRLSGRGVAEAAVVIARTVEALG